MLSSASTLGAVQLARNASLPQRAQAAPVHAALLEGVRQRNAVLDTLFYDVKVVAQDEAVLISPWLAAEGAILLVPPSGEGPLTLCASIEEFVAAGGSQVGCLTVAGVGSSALGSAAFARNVADAIGRPAAAVVSGYGLADVLTEALGGFFWFGALNSIRHSFEGFDQVMQIESDAERAAMSPGESIDTQTVVSLLTDARLDFGLLVGHSKGNLVLSEALYDIKRADAARAKRLAKSVCIVTVSARIAMPLPFRRVIDVMGEWDWFGALNSRPDIPADYVVPHAWHHTNTEVPAHVPVTSTLREVLG